MLGSAVVGGRAVYVHIVSTVVAHSSQVETVSAILPNGGVLVIPAGAMTPGATVTATPESSLRSRGHYAAATAPIHISVSPSNAIRHPLTLELPPSSAAVSRFGAYQIGSYDTSRHQWDAVDSAYDPKTQMLVAEIDHFSIWSTIASDAHLTEVAVDCAKDAATSEDFGKDFLICMVKTEAEDQIEPFEQKVLGDTIPAACLNAMIEAAIGMGKGAPVGGTAALGVLTFAELMKIELTDPSCVGHAGESGVSISTVSPNSGPTSGGNTVTLTGIGLMNATQVTVGGVNAQFSLDPGKGYVLIGMPAHAAGAVDIQVRSGGTGSAVSPSDRYTYVAAGTSSGGGGKPAPPSSGPPAGGTTSQTISIGWSSAHPGWITIELSGFSPGRYQYECGFSSGGDQTYSLTESVSPEEFDNGQTCQDGRGGDQVWVGIGSTRSNTITVPASSGGAPPNPSTPTPAPPPPPAPAPTTYPETVGGVSHTWTDYEDAGGTEGPEIANQQTVRISCRLTGFKVQDGNTWWYRIAQSPWDDQYYVSADAFYNNGTSGGSLANTPFYDPAVPVC